jgi:hypothetical protein
MARLTLGALLLCGCSFTFDGSAPDVVLLPGVPSLEGRPEVVQQAGEQLRMMPGADGTQWALLYTTVHLRVWGGARAVRLASPEAEERFADIERVGGRAVYWRQPVEDKAQPTRVVMRRFGDPAERVFELPPGGGSYVTSPEDHALAFAPVPAEGEMPEATLVRTDHPFRRDVLPPFGVAGLSEPGPAFDRSGDHYFGYTSAGQIIAFSTNDQRAAEVGRWFKDPSHVNLIRVDDAGAQLILCGGGGLASVRFDGTGGEIIDASPCKWSFSLEERSAIYFAGGELRMAPVDRSSPPRRLAEWPAGRRVLAMVPGVVAYTDGESTDGYIDGRRFMERGRLVTFSRDRSRVRFLEHAATLQGEGVLMSAPIGGGEAMTLARNVRDYAELDDGRVIAASNQAFTGTHNRVIVIDENARSARTVAESASAFKLIAGTREVLVERVIERADHSTVWVRMPIP